MPPPGTVAPCKKPSVGLRTTCDEGGQMLVAVLGTGKMGTAVARRLDEMGHELSLWNRTRGRAEAVGVGIVGKSPAQAVAGAEVVLSSLTGPDAVEEVYLGRDGALDAADGQVFADLSTIGPQASLALAKAARDRGASFLDAPVLGNLDAARSGRLVVLVGGESPDIERARTVLASIGEVRIVGATGSASRLKLVANTELALVNLMAGELLAAGIGLGLDQDAVWSVLTRLVPYLDSRRSGFLEEVYEPATFTLRDMLKDLRLALAAYEERGSEVPVTALATELFAHVTIKHADDDLSAIAALWRDRQPS